MAKAPMFEPDNLNPPQNRRFSLFLTGYTSSPLADRLAYVTNKDVHLFQYEWLISSDSCRLASGHKCTQEIFY